MIASTFKAMHADFEQLKTTLLKNGYPLSLIQSKIRVVLNHLRKPSVVVHTCAKKQVFLSLPFTGKHGLQIRTKMYKLFKVHFPQLDLRVVFKPTHRLSSYFTFKDRVPLDVRSLVVYNYTCRGCNASYIGKTKRHFFQRVCEHRGISSRTKRSVAVPPHSAIRDHCLDTGHSINPDDFRIIASASDPLDLGIQECLLIQKHKPSLNTQTPGTELQLFVE